MTTFAEHDEHGRWQQIGRCVYCKCGTRLFQGTLPADQRAAAEALDNLAAALWKLNNQGDQPT